MIEKLTAHQEAQLDVYFEKWLAIGLRHGATDRAAAEIIIDEVYRIADLQPPAQKIWARSPIEGLRRVIERTGEKNISKHMNNACYGQHDAGWLSFYDYCHTELALDCSEIRPITELSQICGWFFPYDDFVVLTDLPLSVALDSSGRLHCESGPAIHYGDGEAFYFWHDVHVPSELIMQEITLDTIGAQVNVELRRVALERYGYDKYLIDIGARPIHSDSFGKLFSVSIGGDENLTMVQVRNSTPEPDGSYKQYFLLVHPELRPIFSGDRFGEPQEMTARNAVASTFGLTGEDYAPAIET